MSRRRAPPGVRPSRGEPRPGARGAGATLLCLLAAAPALAGPAGDVRADRPGKPPDPSKPLVITEPGTQAVLPSGMVEMDPARGSSTGDADRIEPTIGWRSGAPR